MRAPRIEGFGHVDLTVTDGERSARWWAEVLAFKLLVKEERPGFRGWSMLHPSGVSLNLVTHDDGAAAAFDERVVGLDHIAFNVRDRATLEQWVVHLDSLGVAHSEIKQENGGPLMTVRDPDNIQLELHAFDPGLVTLPAGPPS
jgi:catechol 2,3-dioxygenase-like lactoylglutathione lyase family enzyme